MTTPLRRTDYPTLREAVYLNQASLGLIGSPATDAMDQVLHRVLRHGNLYLSDDDEAAFLGGLRERAARLFDVDPGRIAIVGSASELLGQAPLLLAPPPGATVLAVATDFPAITRPWLRLAAEGGCRVEFALDDPQSDLTDALIARIDDGTAVVAVGWVQYATGTVIDVPRLAAAARRVGARLVLDVTQGAGALPCPAGSWDADLVVSSGYKWLGGHGGVALGVVGIDLVARTPPLPGWMGALDPFAFDATSLSLATDARRFTQATMSYASVVGLTASLDRLLEAGLDRIEQHATRLRAALLGQMAEHGWFAFRAVGDRSASGHIVGLRPPAGSAATVTERLRLEAVVCSARLDLVRVSLAPYNDDSDVAALVAGLIDR